MLSILKSAISENGSTDELAKVILTDWVSGLHTIKLIKLIQEHTGLGLAGSKNCTDRLLENEVVVIDMPSLETAQKLAQQATDGGQVFRPTKKSIIVDCIVTLFDEGGSIVGRSKATIYDVMDNGGQYILTTNEIMPPGITPVACAVKFSSSWTYGK